MKKIIGLIVAIMMLGTIFVYAQPNIDRDLQWCSNKLPNRGTMILADATTVSSEFSSTNNLPRQFYLALPNGECSVHVTSVMKRIDGRNPNMVIDGQQCEMEADTCIKDVTINRDKPAVLINGFNAAYVYLMVAYSCV